MNLYHTYSKIIIIKNHLKYFWVVISIVLTYVAISFSTAYINNILTLYSGKSHFNLHNIFISILTIFYIAGLASIIYQYYNIMKSGMRDYYILMGLGAMKKDIRFLILIQVTLFIIIILPLGLFCGYMLTEVITDYLSSLLVNKIILKINSSATLMLITGGIAILIIAIGFYLERIICNMPITYIISGNFITDQEDNL